MEANATPGHDLIVLATGTYRLDLRSADFGTDEDPARGDLDVRDGLTLQGVFRRSSTTAPSESVRSTPAPPDRGCL